MSKRSPASHRKHGASSSRSVTVAICVGIVLAVAGTLATVADFSEQMELVSVVVTSLGLALFVGVAWWDNSRNR